MRRPWPANVSEPKPAAELLPAIVGVHTHVDVRRWLGLVRGRLLLLALLSAWSPLAPHARAERPEATAETTERHEPPALLRLAPSMADVQRARTERLEARLVRMLRALPEIADAHVALALPTPDTSLRAPPPRAHVAVVLTLRAAGPNDAELRRLVASVVPDLAEVPLAITRRALPVSTPPPLVRVGPFEVTAASAPSLRLALSVILITNAALALIVLQRAWRHRPPEPKVDRGGRS